MENIRIETRDWLYNAGIVGLINILRYSGDFNDSQMKSDYIEIPISSLDDFERKYYDFFFGTYREIMLWYGMRNAVCRMINAVENETKVNDNDVKFLKDKLENKIYKNIIRINKQELSNLSKELLEDFLLQLDLETTYRLNENIRLETLKKMSTKVTETKHTPTIIEIQ